MNGWNLSMAESMDNIQATATRRPAEARTKRSAAVRVRDRASGCAEGESTVSINPPVPPEALSAQQQDNRTCEISYRRAVAVRGAKSCTASWRFWSAVWRCKRIWSLPLHSVEGSTSRLLWCHIGRTCSTQVKRHGYRQLQRVATVEELPMTPWAVARRKRTARALRVRCGDIKGLGGGVPKAETVITLGDAPASENMPMLGGV